MWILFFLQIIFSANEIEWGTIFHRINLGNGILWGIRSLYEELVAGNGIMAFSWWRGGGVIGFEIGENEALEFLGQNRNDVLITYCPPLSPLFGEGGLRQKSRSKF